MKRMRYQSTMSKRLNELHFKLMLCVCVWFVHEKFSTVSSPVCDRGTDSSLVVVAERTNRILLVCQGCRFELTIVVIIQYSLQSTISV